MTKHEAALLGKVVRDKITGFTGVVTCRGENLHGPMAFVVTPGLDKDGRHQGERWFSAERLEIVGKKGAEVQEAETEEDIDDAEEEADDEDTDDSDDDEKEEAPKKGKKKSFEDEDDEADDADESDEDDAEDESDDEEEESDEDDVPAPKAKKAKKFTNDDCNDAAKALAISHGGKPGRAKVLSLMKKHFKTESVSELKPEQYGKFIELMKKNTKKG